jgi:hypothetical protein
MHDSGSEDEKRILVFATEGMVDLLTRYGHWFVDGTFRVSPNIYYQLLTVHVLVNETTIPCLYALLPDKTTETYRRFWRCVKDGADTELKPLSILSDFELASIQSIKAEFPTTNVVGCFFHLSQAVWRKIQSSGLTDVYKNNEEARMKLKCLLSLAFLPEDRVTGKVIMHD